MTRLQTLATQAKNRGTVPISLRLAFTEGLMDNTGPGCGVPGRRGLWKTRGPEVCGKHEVPESVENTGSVVFVTSAHDQRSYHCQLMSFPKVSKCQARLLVINNRIYLTISSYVSVRLSRYQARGKFGEHERDVRVARGAAESNSSDQCRS